MCHFRMRDVNSNEKRRPPFTHVFPFTWFFFPHLKIVSLLRQKGKRKRNKEEKKKEKKKNNFLQRSKCNFWHLSYRILAPQRKGERERESWIVPRKEVALTYKGLCLYLGFSLPLKLRFEVVHEVRADISILFYFRHTVYREGARWLSRNISNMKSKGDARIPIQYPRFSAPFIRHWMVDIDTSNEVETFLWNSVSIFLSR